MSSNFICQLVNMNNSCVNCDNLCMNGLLVENKLYCNTECFKAFNTPKQVINIVYSTDNNNVSYSKSISYYCRGCSEKYFNSDKPRLDIGGMTWCSKNCRETYLTRNLRY
jgi:hypothetical protein